MPITVYCVHHVEQTRLIVHAGVFFGADNESPFIAPRWSRMRFTSVFARRSVEPNCFVRCLQLSESPPFVLIIFVVVPLLPPHSPGGFLSLSLAINACLENLFGVVEVMRILVQGATYIEKVLYGHVEYFYLFISLGGGGRSWGYVGGHGGWSRRRT